MTRPTKPLALALLASVAAAPLCAEEHREMSAHVHGTSSLELAIEGDMLEMNLLSPGMDLVGFEYAPQSAADKDADEAAIRVLLLPEQVVSLPEAAGCRLAEVLVHRHGEDHDHEGEADEDHDHEGHDDHDDHDHDDHDHDEGHDDHDDHDHDDHDHEGHDHEEGAAHSEYHARYHFTCDAPEALTQIAFPFFAQFEHAQKISAQYVTAAGAGAADVARDQAVLVLK